MARRDKGNYLAASADCAPTFCWLGSAMPTWLDLRQCGWTLSNDSQPGLGCTGVFHVSDTDQAEAMKVLLSTPAEKRREVLVIGIEPARERAALLQVGFGDVMSRDIALDELRARPAAF